MLLSIISNVFNLLGVSVWCQQLLKARSCCSAPPPLSAGGSWRVNEHRPGDPVTKG
jgi:hypothetical protein